MDRSTIRLFLSGLTLFSTLNVMAQFTATLNQQVNTCSKVLTISATGGSGNYQFAWGAINGCGTPQNYSQSSLTISNCATSGTYYAFVRDLNTNVIKYVEANVAKSISGAISMSFPNVFTPNGDGINDYLVLGTSNGGSGVTNIHTLVLKVKNRWGVEVFNQTYTNYITGLIAPYPTWNGGNNSPNSPYFLDVTATNCTTSSPYTGQITFLN